MTDFHARFRMFLAGGGRSRDRYRRAALAGTASVLSRGIGIVTLIAVVPLTLDYLGAERYGLWMTITSVMSFFALVNLGLDNSLLNALSDAHGRDDPNEAARLVSAAAIVLGGVALLGAALFALLYGAVDWGRVFNVTAPDARAEAGPALAAFVLCIAAAVPLGIVVQAQQGYQEGYVAAFWEGLGRLAALLAVVVVVAAEGGLVMLVLAMTGVPVVAVFLNGLDLFARRKPWLRPRLALFDWARARRLLGQGAMFFAITLTSGAAFWSDNIIAAHILGPEAVTQYAVPFRLFSVAAMLIAFFVSALWPAYGEALARGDGDWVVRTLRRTLWVSMGGTAVVSIFLVVFGDDILRVWVGDAVVAAPWLLPSLALWSIASAGWLAVSVFLNGTRQLRFELWVVLAMAVGAVGTKVVLTAGWGLPGIALGNVVGFVVFAGVPLSLCLPGIARRLRAGTLRPETAAALPAEIASPPGERL